MVKQEYHNYHNYCFLSIFTKKLTTNMSNCSQMCVKMGKIVMISDNYHDIGRLLFLMIFVKRNNWMILIIV